VHARAIRPVQENPIGPDELQGIPLDRVVARRDRDAAAGCMVLDGKLDRRCRDQTDFDDGAPRSNAGPDSRASRPTTTNGFRPVAQRPKARA